jgi:hypothetical protein
MNDQVARALIERADAQISWLTQISRQLAETKDRQAAGYIQQAGKIQSLLELLVSQIVPASPEVTLEITINNVTPTLLYRNDSLPFRRIEITNDDPAQMCWLGKRNVSPLNGRVLLAQTTVPYVLPQGDEVWAICVVATISRSATIWWA